MKFNTLYKRAVNGKINEWTVGDLFETATFTFAIAKEKEKQQIIDTARYYFHEHGKLTPEKYYNETYGK